MNEGIPSDRREAESEQEDWDDSETATAFLWISNQEDLYFEACRRVSEAGNYFDGADALENWVEAENPLGDQEPSLYASLMLRAIANIDWHELAEAFAPQAWTEPSAQNPDAPAV